MEETHIRLADEAQQAFYQRENLVMSVDVKAFGVIAIDAVLSTIFLYLLTEFKSTWLAIPYVFLVFSLIFLAKCVWPVKWNRPSIPLMLNEYWDLDYKEVIEILSANYIQLDGLLKKIYEYKFKNFYIGIKLVIVALILEIMIITSILVVRVCGINLNFVCFWV